MAVHLFHVDNPLAQFSLLPSTYVASIREPVLIPAVLCFVTILCGFLTDALFKLAIFIVMWSVGADVIFL